MIKKVVAGIIGIFLISGCASIVSKSNYPVTLSSTPEMVEFTIRNKEGLSVHKGRTPATVTLKSGSGYFAKEEYTVLFQKEGFEEQTVTLSSSIDGWYFGNILFGGLIGILIIDPVTGAMWKLPETISASLAEMVSAEGANGRTLSVAMIDEVPAEMLDSLIRIK